MLTIADMSLLYHLHVSVFSSLCTQIPTCSFVLYIFMILRTGNKDIVCFLLYRKCGAEPQTLCSRHSLKMHEQLHQLGPESNQGYARASRCLS